MGMPSHRLAGVLVAVACASLVACASGFKVAPPGEPDEDVGGEEEVGADATTDAGSSKDTGMKDSAPAKDSAPVDTGTPLDPSCGGCAIDLTPAAYFDCADITKKYWPDSSSATCLCDPASPPSHRTKCCVRPPITANVTVTWCCRVGCTL